jgi:hypothetical protein
MAIVRVEISDPEFNEAYCNAKRTLPVISLERPRQYFQRWEETFSCRVRGEYVEFPNEETYTWFMLKWR